METSVDRKDLEEGTCKGQRSRLVMLQVTLLTGMAGVSQEGYQPSASWGIPDEPIKILFLGEPQLY